MSESKLVVDADSKNFESIVIEESWRRPVVVDFWAAWCAPCRMLGPVLEKLAAEYEGSFLLAKLDSDANLQLSERYGIRSIPNVKVFKDGAVVDEFVGVIPEAELRAFLRRHCPTEADRHLQEAMLELKMSRKERARTLLEKAIEADPIHGGALLELGRLCALEGDLAGAQSYLDRIPGASPLWEQAQTLKEVFELQRTCRAGGGPGVWAQKVLAEPDDLEARFGHGCCQIVSGNYRKALDEFLYIVSREKDFRDQAARKAMLTVFKLIGDRSELAEEYRKRLALVLY